MQIADDKVVTFHFSLTSERGEVIESSQAEEPLKYLHGRGNLIEGLERAMVGRGPGDKFEITLDPADAYGEREPDLVRRLEKSDFAGEEQIEVGGELQIEGPDGHEIVTITEVGADHVTVDGNHPLAGEKLTFEIEILELRDATGEELSHGHVHDPGGHHH